MSFERRSPKMKAILANFALAVMLAGKTMAQEPQPPLSRPDQAPPPTKMLREGGPLPMGLHGQRAWWRDPRLRHKLQLSDEQSQQIENISRNHRMREIDLRAEVEKQSIFLQQQMEADTPDLAQVRAQIDKLAQARAQLEKSQVEMVLAIRHVLTAEQAKRLRELAPGATMPGPGFGPLGGAPPPPDDGQKE
jgi:Spy/CpxP family protein refolding chaperone